MYTLMIEILDEDFKKVERQSKKFCEWAKEAREGKEIFIGKNSISCPLALFKLGYDKPADLETTLIGWSDAVNEEKAKQYLDSTKRIQGQKVFHLAPELKNPDLTVYFGYPDEIMRKVREYSSKTGKRIIGQVSGIGAMCGELCAFPYVTNQPNLSVGCGGSRKRVFRENEIAVVFPCRGDE